MNGVKVNTGLEKGCVKSWCQQRSGKWTSAQPYSNILAFYNLDYFESMTIHRATTHLATIER